METPYLKAHPLGNHYPKWTPDLHLDRSQYLKICTRGSQDPRAQAVTMSNLSQKLKKTLKLLFPYAARIVK